MFHGLQSHMHAQTSIWAHFIQAASQRQNGCSSDPEQLHCTLSTAHRSQPRHTVAQCVHDVEDEGDEEAKAGPPHSPHGCSRVRLVRVLLGFEGWVASAAQPQTRRSAWCSIARGRTCGYMWCRPCADAAAPHALQYVTSCMAASLQLAASDSASCGHTPGRPAGILQLPLQIKGMHTC